MKTTFNRIISHTPNRSSRLRDFSEITAVILHHTCGTWKGSISWIENPQSRVSYHIIIDVDGLQAHILPIRAIAWHAGESRWKGRPHCNLYTIGIAFTGDTVTGHLRPQKSLTSAEIESAAQVIYQAEKNIGKQIEILSHALVSPGRKNDVSDAALLQVKTYLDRK
jgi:N-acetyl-anhydromuramyl-L-alanine amidase AmpD